MNIIVKRANEILKNKRVTKSKKSTIKNTINFSKEFKINIIDSRIDFLTIRLQEDNTFGFIELECFRLWDYNTIFDRNIDIDSLTGICKFLDFYIVFSGLAFGNQKKIYSIFDKDRNKIGQVVLKNTEITKKNNNVINELEFKGLFFKCYVNFLEDFFYKFNIDKTKKKIIKRIDYCIDLQGIQVFELVQYIKTNKKVSKSIEALVGTDKRQLVKFLEGKTLKNIDERSLNIKYGEKETYKNYVSEHNDFKVYDKILDILDNSLNRKVNGINPYQDYIDSEYPITRIEVKKNDFSNLTDDSINRMFKDIEALCFDYLLRYFELDLSLYIGVGVSFNGKKTFIAKEKKQKNLQHSLKMAKAYLKNIEKITNKKVLYRFLCELYPDFKRVNIKNLALSREEVVNYLLGIDGVYGEKPINYYLDSKKNNDTKENI